MIECDQKEKERGERQKGRMRDYILGSSLSIKDTLDNKESQRQNTRNDK